jgi:(1->4)-alpha-D-glucan 1-alpha-D-glucosylmutase
LRTFIERILDPALSGEFLNALDALAQRLALLGALNSLSQVTLKAMMPGVPDFYQGTELWDLSFVDPDNRRPVDFATRMTRLAALERPDWARLAQDWQSGELKFAWTRHLLKARAEQPDLFAAGDYQPLEVSGPHRGHVIAFARRHGRAAAIIAVMKGFASLTEAGRTWPRMETLEGSIALQGLSLEGTDAALRELPLASLFATLPVAVVKARTATTTTRVRHRVSA